MPDAGGASADTYAVHERRSTRARRVRVEVRRDGTVWLVIPHRTSRADALAFLASRRAWIARARLRLAQLLPTAVPPPLAWDGTGHLPLAGQDVPLLHIASRLSQPRVRFTATRVEVYAPPHSTPDALERALRGGLWERARVCATRLLDAEAARLGVTYLGPRIADQRSRWGSCAASGLISLNWRLVMAPEHALRYIVVHELCHRIHADHSARFWALVERQMPGWAEQRQWLREGGTRLHAILPARPAGGCPPATTRV